jgi:hypothetical protein
VTHNKEEHHMSTTHFPDPPYALAKAARQLDAPPHYEAGNSVDVRGEELDKPIYWQGRQWAVTPYGVERRDGTYVIEHTRLWEGEKTFGWVLHMAGKTWVDVPDFAEALRIARRWERLRAERQSLDRARSRRASSS